ncbi:MAG: sugar phosphate isomerase/epimerase [Clostridiales bacterium]|nr:sugar phosphate isomerase/epimerase [Clostridiales bacterium]
MRLGGSVVGPYTTPSEWEALLVATRFRAVTAPFNCHTPEEDIRAFMDIVERHDVAIAEIGVWRNPFDPDPSKAAEALDYAIGQLKLADRLGIPCCVNIVGTASSAGWDAADRSNFTDETYARIVDSIRFIIDAAQPKRAYYCIEPMPWMVPDSPDAYIQLIRDVDRRQFAAHMDFVNMINSPRRYLDAEAFVEECFAKLSLWIKSTHIKDIRMHPTRLTTILEEVSPGEGALDYDRVLGTLARWLPEDAPVLLEHMATAEEYARAYDYVAARAKALGLAV